MEIPCKFFILENQVYHAQKNDIKVKVTVYHDDLHTVFYNKCYEAK